MGYHTCFILTYDDPNSTISDDAGHRNVWTRMFEISGIDPDQLENCKEDNGYISFDDIKWYSYENDMKKLSLEYPQLIFNVYGEGEDSNDRWEARYENGISKVTRLSDF